MTRATIGQSSRSRSKRARGHAGRRRALVLLSGGLDSATAAAFARSRGYELYGLTVVYGQRHVREVRSAKAIGRALGLKAHFFSTVTLGPRGSALTDKRAKVPVDRDVGSSVRAGEIPATYVPARNIVMLAIAAHYAELVGAEAIFTGFNVVDYSGYPDCSRKFADAFHKAVRVGTKAGRQGRAPKVLTPLIKLDKAGIVRLGIRLKVPFELTWSCYMGGKRPCGRCDSCRIRAKGFKEAGIKDPLLGR